MNGRSSEWLAPLSGVLFIVLLLISFVVAGEPPTAADDEVSEIIEHYVDNEDSVKVGAGIGVLAALALILFMGYLRSVLRTAEGEGGALSLIAFAGGLTVAIAGAIDDTILFALADSAEDIDPVAVQSLQALWDNDFAPFALGTIAFLFGAGASVVRHGALPAWLGWGAIAFAVVGAAGIATAGEWGFISAPAAALWILVVSILLSVRARRETSPPAAA